MMSSSAASAQTAILIVTYNSAAYLPALLASLERFGYEHVYFCDAASSDDSVAILRQSCYAKHLLCKSRTESFAKNNNDLLRYFRPPQPFLLALNPDTFFHMDIVEGLMQVALKNEQAAIVCPRFLFPDGRPQAAWRNFLSVRQAMARRLRLIPPSPAMLLEPGPIDWCLGACLLVRRAYLDRPDVIFDERYRLYCEDADLCLAMHLKGYQVLATDTATVFHHLGHVGFRQPFSRQSFWNLTSMAKFLLKWRRQYTLHLNAAR